MAKQSAEKPKTYKIVKTEKFVPKISQLGHFVKDWQLREDFKNGLPIEVQEEAFNGIKKLGWCIIARESK